MELQEKKITFMLALNCRYGGNLIPSLMYLAKFLTCKYKANITWVLPRQEKAAWIVEAESKYKVYYTTAPYNKSADELYDILNEIKPDIVHTHFELYDISVAKAISRIDKEIKQVWHVHDIMSFSTKGEDKRLLRYLKRKIIYPLRYHWYGRKAYYIAVSHQMAAFVGHFRKHFLTEPPHYSNEALLNLKFPNVTTIINGMVESRLQKSKDVERKDNVFTFLTFGGNFRGKGIDIVLNACKKLEKAGTPFRILITKGNSLEESIHNFLNTEKLPSWVKIVPQIDDIASLFEQSDCYISASRGETMSFAIAEATYFMLPVIQSDIPGTYWNAKNPSTYMFKNEDAEDLYMAMMKVMQEDKTQITEKCAETLKCNKALLNIDVWKEKIINIYRVI